MTRGVSVLCTRRYPAGGVREFDAIAYRFMRSASAQLCIKTCLVHLLSVRSGFLDRKSPGRGREVPRDSPALADRKRLTGIRKSQTYAQGYKHAAGGLSDSARNTRPIPEPVPHRPAKQGQEGGHDQRQRHEQEAQEQKL